MVQEKLSWMLPVVYWEKLEMTKVKMETGEEDLVLIFPSHLGGKQNVYIESEKLDTAKFDKSDVSNK